MQTTAPPNIRFFNNSRLWLVRLGWLCILAMVGGIYIEMIPVNYTMTANEWAIQQARNNLPGLLSYNAYVWIIVLLEYLSGAFFIGISMLIAWRKHADWFALYISATLLLLSIMMGISSNLDALLFPPWIAFLIPHAWLTSNFFLFPATALLLLFFLFPSGCFSPRPMSLVASLGILWLWLPRIPPLDRGLDFLFQWGELNADGGWLLYMGVYLGTIVAGWISQIYRYWWISDPVERQQTKWLLVGLVMPLLYILITLWRPGWAGNPAISEALGLLTGMAIPLTIALAIFRYRFWDIDVVVQRSLVYGLLSGLIVLLYVISVGVVGNIFQGTSEHAIALIAVTTVGLAVLPLYRKLHALATLRMSGQSLNTPRVDDNYLPSSDQANVRERDEALKSLDSENLPNLSPGPLTDKSVALHHLRQRPVLHATVRRPYPWVFYSCFMALTFIAIGWLLLGTVPALYDADVVSLERIKSFVAQIREWTRYNPSVAAIVSASYRSQRPVFVLFQYFFSMVNLTMAFVLVYLRPNDWVARLFAIGMVGTAAIFNLESHTVQYFGGPLADFIHSWLHLIAGGSYLLALMLFPHGEFPSLPIAGLSVPKVISLPLQAVLGLLIALFGSGTMWDGEPEAYVFWYGLIAPVFGITAQSLRYWQADTPEERRLSRIFVWAMSLALALTMVIGVSAWLLSTPLFNLPLRMRTEIIFFAFPLLYTMLPLSLTLLVLRYRLWGLELLINRSLLYGTLVTIIALLYVFLVGGLGRLVVTRSSWLLSIAATGIVAILFHPIRLSLQSTVNRLLFGQRDEPAKVLSDLAARLAVTVSPEDTLPSMVETIRNALKLPHVSVFMIHGSALRQMGSAGEPQAVIEKIPITFHGERLGELHASPRRPENALTSGDRRLLAKVANQAGAALHAVQLTTDLKRSREQLVSAREEERRRLRRDLHDGLGPHLATLSLKIDAARNLLREEPERVDQLLVEYKSQTQEALADLRRIVYELRPPALDQLGLDSALKQHLTTCAVDTSITFNLVITSPLPSLPAAVEVAAYRIVLEAVTNVVRHAEAERCTVRLRTGQGLEIEVEDDGKKGFSEDKVTGLGILSMTERAVELGGQFRIDHTDRGTLVRAVLPLPE